MRLEINGATASTKLGPSTGPAVPGSAVKYGRMRHILALLALTSLVMANMNRQAYNQGLSRMKKKLPAKGAVAALAPVPGGELGLPPPPPPKDTEGLGASGASLDRPPYGVAPVGPAPEVALAAETAQEEEDDGFDWTSSQVGLLQAAFSYGYTVFMIPGGRLSEVYGAKWVIFLSSFGSALCSILTPLFASHSYALLVASRVVMGVCQTGVSPAMYAFCSRWLSPDEASVYLPMIKVAVMVGFMLGSLLNGLLPWRAMFYLIGLAGLAWSAVWALFATSDPSDHVFLHAKELAYIRHSLSRRAREDSLEQRDLSENQEEEKKKSESAPWLSIITNPVVLAFTFTKFTVKFSTDTQSMQIPMYLKQVFNVSDGLNGILNGANFSIQAVCTGFVAYTAKEMVARKTFGLNKTGVRILFQSINNFGMGLAYLLISFNMGSLNLVCGAVMILCTASMFGAGGEAVLPIDLTTEYSASIMAIANSVANMSGIILPPIVSFFIADDYTNSHHWNKVWWFVSSTMICGGLMFACFVQAKIQDFEGKQMRQRKQRSGKQTVQRGNLTPSAGFTIQMVDPHDGPAQATNISTTKL